MSLLTTHKLLKPVTLLLLGAFSIFGFAPFYCSPASIASIIGLCYFWYLSESPKQAALAGFLYGLGLFGTGIYWIYISLHVYGGMPNLMAGISTLALAAFMALFPSAAGALSKRISGNNHYAMVMIIPALWALSDWVRSWIFTGFPWLTVGYSQVPDSPLAGYMPILGVYSVTLLTVFFASLTALWFTNKPITTKWRRNGIATLIMLMVSGHLLKLLEWTTPSGNSISVSLLQGNIAQDMKWDPEIANQTLNQYLNMAESSTARLIVMPETALPVLSSELPTEVKSRLHQQAVQNQGGILVGLVEREDGEYFNSVLSFGSSESATYRKSHLVPFGEFIPFKVAFGWIYRDLLNMPLSDLSRGNKYQQPMSIAGEKIAINICYEDVFGEEIIRQLPTATLLVNVSNDAWYGTSYAADQHMQFSQARALETGRMMLRATNTGATAIIDHKGHVIAHAPHFTQTALNGMAQGYIGTTPYVRWGNWPLIIFCFGIITLVWRRNAITRT
jgi:apolipoprotein N-acyltransferase